MRQTAEFYTYFWIVYFPTCIAYNDLPGFMYVDEIMTVVLMLYTFMNMGKKWIIKDANNEYKLFLRILAFFVLYSLVFGVNVHAAVWRDLIQWIRPFSVIYCTWILNPKFTQKQKNWMIYSMVFTLVSWIFYHLQAFNEKVEFPVLGQLAMCTGMSWYLYKKDTNKNKYIALTIVLLGMLAPKFKYLGELVCFVYVLFFMKKRMNFKSPRTIVSLLSVMAVVLYVTWSKFDAYYITGFTDSANYRMARPETFWTSLLILKDYFPFGSGMGSFGVKAAADYYSPLYFKYNLNTVWGLTPEDPSFLCDAFYPTLSQFGVVGVFLFYIFWKRRLKAFSNILDMRYYRIAWITFFCLAIEQSADTSFLSGKGMGYCMLIALCLNANRNFVASDEIKAT